MRVGGCKGESWVGVVERQIERGSNQPLMLDNNDRFFLLKVVRYETFGKELPCFYLCIWKYLKDQNKKIIFSRSTVILGIRSKNITTHLN